MYRHVSLFSLLFDDVSPRVVVGSGQGLARCWWGIRQLYFSDWPIETCPLQLCKQQATSIHAPTHLDGLGLRSTIPLIKISVLSVLFPSPHLALPNPYHLTSSVSLRDRETQTQPPSNVLGLVSLIDSTLAWLCLPFDPVKLVHVFHAHAHSCAQRFLHPYRLGVNPKKIH